MPKALTDEVNHILGATRRTPKTIKFLSKVGIKSKKGKLRKMR
jgi:hypothetical protein